MILLLLYSFMSFILRYICSLLIIFCQLHFQVKPLGLYSNIYTTSLPTPFYMPFEFGDVITRTLSSNDLATINPRNSEAVQNPLLAFTAVSAYP